MRDRYGYAIGLSQCPRGLAYLNPRMDAAGYARFYDTAYRPLVDRINGRDTSDASADVRAKAQATYLASLLWPVRSLLDVGGGRGVMARALGDRLHAERVTVVDPNPAEIAHARARGCEGLVGTAESFTTAERFDLIVCIQTADHWLDPITALRQLRAVAAPWTRLFVDIIDVPVYQTRAQTPCVWKIDHPLYWTRIGFMRALRQSGWTPLRQYHQETPKGPANHRPGFLCEGA